MDNGEPKKSAVPEEEQKKEDSTPVPFSSEEPTVSVKSSLERAIEHEVLRRESSEPHEIENDENSPQSQVK